MWYQKVKQPKRKKQLKEKESLSYLYLLILWLTTKQASQLGTQYLRYNFSLKPAKSVFSQPWFVRRDLVLEPCELSVEALLPFPHQQWQRPQPLRAWWTPKVYHRHSRLEPVGQNPVPHAPESSICQNLKKPNKYSPLSSRATLDQEQAAHKSCPRSKRCAAFQVI